MKNLFHYIKQRSIINMFIVAIYSSILLCIGCDCSTDHKVTHEETETQSESPLDALPAPGSGPAYNTEPVYATGSPVETTVSESGTFNISVQVSRINGIAPLAVFFDATGTTGLTDNGFFADNAAYMDATFSWDFDADDTDPTGRHEKASGFVAAHVFERPGSYRVHLDIYDAAGGTDSIDIAITVSAFNGTTYYVANGGSDSNTGLTMDDPFATPAYALSSSILEPNVQVLFKNGDTFTISNMVTISDETGPIVIGSYSDPDDPSDRRPVIHTTAVNSDWATVYFWNCSDIRILDIAARATAESSESPRYPFGIGWGNGCTHMLKYRTREYLNGGISLSPCGQYNNISECAFHDTTQTGYTTNTDGINERNALIGNWVYDKNMVDTYNEEHVFRLQGGSRYFIAHNTFGPDVIVDGDSLTIRGNSEKVVVYKNILMGFIQDITPQNTNSAEEYQHHCIIDSNLIIGQNLGGPSRITAISIDAKDIVIRNNITYDYQFGITLANDSVVGHSRRIKIYNNTFINPAADDYFFAVSIDAACTDIDIKNNLMVDLAGSNPVQTNFIYLENGTTYNGESDNNIFYGISLEADTNIFGGSTLADWQSATGNDQNSSFADPQIISTNYNDPDFARPRAAVIDAGAFMPAALDYYGNLRDNSRDIGACEYEMP